MIRGAARGILATEKRFASPIEELQRAVANPEWFQHAICKDEDPEVFFPAPSESSRRAREVCERCPVMQECGDWAIVEGIRDGVWGGLSPQERAVIRRQINPGHQPKRQEAEAWARRRRIVEMRHVNTPLSHAEIGEKFGVDKRTIDRDMRILRKKGMLPSE